MSDPTDILNWRRFDSRITLSGQPTVDQFTRMAETGVTAVINLAPQESKDALRNEAAIVQGLGQKYAYIPVDFQAPSETDFENFCKAMNDYSADTVHVHCIYNARVTAFMLRYTREVLCAPDEVMAKMMDGIWRPGGVWARFLNDESRVDLPNQYAGYEY